MESFFKSFNGKVVVITGANGFIGSRLAELLATHSTCEVRTLVRNFGSAIRLARRRVNIIQADILDKTSCNDAFKNADYVFHCAYGNKGTSYDRHRVNIEGTQNVLELVKEHNVTGLLFLSTQAVYGVHPVGEITEDLRIDRSKLDEYGQSKLDTEDLIQKFAASQNINAVILQPSAVYGPWAQSYGLRLIQTFTKFYFPLVKGQNNIANLLYIDDLIQAMALSIVNPVTYGKKYLINGSSDKTWTYFFSRFREMTGQECIVELTREEISRLYKQSLLRPPFFKTLMQAVRLNRDAAKALMVYPVFSGAVRVLRKIIPGKTLKTLKQKGPVSEQVKQVLPVDEATLNFYSSSATVNCTKAGVDFGYTPQFTVEMGFSLMKKWYSWYSDRLP